MIQQGQSTDQGDVEPIQGSWSMKCGWLVTRCLKRGTYHINLTLRVGGEPMQDIGKYISIFERQPRGAWGMARDIGNSNNPPFIGR
jgi:hypothetical protein